MPKTALTDRMGCLKGGTVAGLVIPTPAYVRFATHYGFRPDFCEGADPESKGLVENLVGYVKSDLMIPEAAVGRRPGRRQREGHRLVRRGERGRPLRDLRPSRPSGSTSRRELFGDLPSLRAAIGKIVTRKVDKLSCVRFGSARYSVPNDHIGREVSLRVKDGVIKVVFLGEIVAEHLVVSPGETSIDDDHYGGRATRTPAFGPTQEHGREDLLCPRPGGRCLHQGSGRPRDDRAGP